MLLGAIVRDITDPFFAGAIETVSVAARAKGYNVVLGHAHGEATEAYELAALLEARHCDAILMLGDMSDQPRLLEDLRDTHVPVVALWQGSELVSIPAVNVDNRAGVTAAMEPSRRAGASAHRLHRGTAAGRHPGAAAGLRGGDGRPAARGPAGYVQRVANTPADGETALAAVMRLPVPPTAIVAATDVLAIGVLRGAYVWASASRPTSRSSASTTSLGRYTVPALTTVRMPTAEMATAAIRLAVGDGASDAWRLGGADGAHERASEGGQVERRGGALVRLFPPELVVRQSTARRSA